MNISSFVKIRIIFKVLAFGIFVFQMQNYIFKYIDRPVVQQTSTKHYDDIVKPYIYVCQDEQTNYDAAVQLGYETFTKITYGLIPDNNTIAWTGKYGNLTYEQVQNLMLDVDYSVNSYSAKDDDIAKNTTVHTEMVYIAPYGFCVKVKFLTKTITIKSKRKTFYLFVDPMRENRLVLNIMIIGEGVFGPNWKNLYEGHNFEVEYTLYDHEIHKDITCTDYEAIGSSYGECVETAMQERFLAWYKCLPPWLPVLKNLTCDKDVKAQMPSKQDLDEIAYEIGRFIKGFDTSIFSGCLSPCTSMSMKMINALKVSNKKVRGYSVLDANPEVTVYKGIN